MTQITEKRLSKIAKLAKIEICEIEKKELPEQLTNIFTWIEKLQEVDTENVDILTNVHNAKLTLNEDVVFVKNSSEEVLKLSEHVKYDYYIVPKVIDS